jgi:hypothetical protein
MDEDGGNDVICVVNLDERNRIISMDDPFGPDDNYVYEEEGEELLDESEGEGEDQDGEDQQEGGEADGQDPEIQAEPTLQVPEPPLPVPVPEQMANSSAAVEQETGDEGMDDNPLEIETESIAIVKHPDNLYKAVRSVMAGGQDPLKLNPRMKYNRGEDPGFMGPGDERILRNANMCSMEEKRIASVSFDPVSGRCYTCLNGDHRAWAARDGGPICVILSDQHFPANIPADSDGECMRILRVENGTLTEIADELLRLVPKEGIPKGSVIMYSAISQLGVISAEKYAMDWRKNRNWLIERLGEVIVLPGIPLTSTGVEDRCVIRGMLDISAWFEILPEPELRLLRNARKCWEDTYLSKTRRGQGWSDYRLNLVLPVSLCTEAGTVPCTTGDLGERPIALVRLNEAGERYWIEKIANELNREIGLGLATAWSVGRTMSAVRRQEESVAMGRVYSIGASNAGNTAAALERKGVKVVPISQPGCTITRESVDNAVRILNAEMKKDDIVLIQWLENSIFFMLNSDTGSMVLPTRDEQDGIFHVTGKVTVSKDVQLETLLDKLEPLLSGFPDNLKLLICPLVRYLEDCCAAHPREELAKKEDGIRQMKELYQLRRVLKSWIIRKKFKNVIMFDPLACLGAAASVERAKAAMADCFHLNAKARGIVAGKIKEQIVGWLRGRKRGNDTKAGSEDKRPRLDSAADKSGQSGSGVGKSGAAAARRNDGGKGLPKGRGKGRK